MMAGCRSRSLQRNAPLRTCHDKSQSEGLEGFALNLQALEGALLWKLKEAPCPEFPATFE